MKNPAEQLKKLAQAGPQALKICVTGNIGVGKSTLCQRLADRFTNGHFVGEELENPHLEAFYEHLHRFPASVNPNSLKVQLYFLEKRFENESRAAAAGGGLLVTDRCLLEYNEIFVRNLERSGYLSAEDHAAYQRRFGELAARLPHPQVIFLLQASLDTAMQRIRKRGRAFESSNLDAAYLESLQAAYAAFSATLELQFPDIRVFRIESDGLDEQQVFELAAAIVEKLRAEFAC